MQHKTTRQFMTRAGNKLATYFLRISTYAWVDKKDEKGSNLKKFLKKIIFPDGFDLFLVRPD